MKRDRGAATAQKGLFRTAANDRGVSLMIVLWVMVVLMITVSEFAYTMRAEGESVRNFKDEAAAYYLAVAGINLGIEEVSKGYDLVCLDRDGNVVFKKKKDGIIEDIETEREAVLGGGRVSYTLSDERGKININTASRETVTELLRGAGVEEADRDIIADSILDWREAGREHHANGAKTDYYSSLPHPYASKNGPFDTVEELLLVKGMTPDIFSGSGKARRESGTSPETSGSGYTGIAPYLTVKGDGRININTADEKVLEAALGVSKAQEVMLRRATQGYFELPAYGGIITSDTFLIASKGEVRGMRVGITAIVERVEGSAGVRISYWKEEGVTD